MTSIADLLGLEWESARQYSMLPHAVKQADLKGFAHRDILDAANSPAHTYPNGRYPGQMRHVRAGIVAVVDTRRKQIVTVYEDQRETALRPDQTQRDARRYGERIASRA